MSNPQDGRPVFQQLNWSVQGNVYNVAGDLVLSKESTKEDFQKALDGLRQEILKLRNVEPSRKDELAHDIESVERESRRDAPEKGIVVSRLNSVKATLEALTGTVVGAGELGKVVAQAALWAAAFFR
jgi:hypothetical protein